jgi:hypothetical protein
MKIKTMSIKYILPILFFTIYFFSCKKTETTSTIEETNPSVVVIPTNACEPPVFNKKLKKTISTTLETVPTINETSYFYDNQNRVDSITESSFYTLILYDVTGKVAKTARKRYSNNYTLFEDIHNYKNGVLKTILHQENQLDGTPSIFSIVINYEWNNNNHLKKIWSKNASHKTVYTVDSCGNVLKEQDFNNINNREHRSELHKFATTFSPYFLIGLDVAFPNQQYYKHNIIYSESACWDCGFYGPWIVKTTYEYNAYGLPSKSTNGNTIVEFFYE